MKVIILTLELRILQLLSAVGVFGLSWKQCCCRRGWPVGSRLCRRKRIAAYVSGRVS